MQLGSEHNGVPLASNESKHQSALQGFFPYMVHVARKLVGGNDAEDVANAALFDAWRSKHPQPSLDKPLEVKRYLRRLVWFRALAHWKRKKKFRREISASPEIEYNDSPSTTALNSFETFILRRTLEHGMRGLDQEEKAALRAYYGEGLTAKELAAHLGELESTVRSRIDRAAQKVAKALEREPKNVRSSWAIFLPIDEIHECLSRFCIRLTNLAKHVGLTKMSASVGACVGLAIPVLYVASQWDEASEHPQRGPTFVMTNAVYSPPLGPSETEPTRLPFNEQASPVQDEPILTPPVLPRPVSKPKPHNSNALSTKSPKPPAQVALPNMAAATNASVSTRQAMSCEEALNVALAEANVDRPANCRRVLEENAASSDPCSATQRNEALRNCYR